MTTALEQIALELGERKGLPALSADGAPYEVRANMHLNDVAQPAPQGQWLAQPAYVAPQQPTGAPHAAWAGNASIGTPQFVPPACPVHGKPWRNGKFGAYCATKQDDGSWCNYKPQVVTGLQTAQLP